MKRKDYQEPTMEFVKCEQEEQLLAGSVQSLRESYGIAEEQEWN